MYKHMAQSQKKTTIAILRGVLGATHGREENFARLMNKSGAWVKRARAGHIPLTEQSARDIHHATGINLAWLLKNDISEPPINSAGEPYTFECFQARRVELTSGDIKARSVFRLKNVLSEIAGIGSAAGKSGKLSLFQWRYTDFAEKCREEFGFDDEASNAALKKTAAAKLPEFTVSDSDQENDPRTSNRYHVSSMEEIVEQHQAMRESGEDGTPPIKHGGHRHSTAESMEISPG